MLEDGGGRGLPEEWEAGLTELEAQLEGSRPARWESFPDIPLYMDQVVAYLGRQLIGSGRGEALTSAMINNYIKDGLAPRAQGKRYGREHLAYLTLVAALKQVLSVRDMSALLHGGERPADAQALYAGFLDSLDLALGETLEHVRGFPRREDLSALALNLALRSYADALACRRIVALLGQGEDGKKKKHRDGEAVS